MPLTEQQVQDALSAVTGAEQKLNTVLEKQNQEIKDTRTTSDRTANKVAELEGALTKAHTDIAAATERANALDIENKKTIDRIAEIEKAAKRIGFGGSSGDGDSRSIGARFVEEIQKNGSLAVLKSGARGAPGLRLKGMSVDEVVDRMIRKSNLLTSDATRFVAPERLPMDTIVNRPLTIANLLRRVPTTSNAVEFIKIVGFGKTDTASISTITVSGSVATATFAAPHGYQIGDYFEVSGVSGGVAEEDAYHNSVFMITGVPTSSIVTYAINSSATASASGTKLGRRMRGGAAATRAESVAAAEARLKPVLATANVFPISHFIPVSRMALDDIPQLQGLVDGELMFGTELELERVILYGAGGGSEIQGICSHPDIQTYTGADPDTKLDVIRRAVTRAMLSNYPPTAGVIHPTDFEQIELTKGSDGHYVWVQVPTGGGNVLWRLPIVVTASMLEGDALVGNFQMAATLHDRMEPEVRFSEHHASYFIAGMLALLCELRAGLSISRPESFVSIDFGTATH